MELQRVTKELLKKVDGEIAACRKRKRQPTVVALIVHPKTGKLLVIWSKKKGTETDDNPGFPKGGPEKGERAHLALIREIWEELRIRVTIKDILGCFGKAVVPSLRGKNGFSDKEYHIFYVLPKRRVRVRINRAELDRHQWLGLRQCREVFTVLRSTRQKKYEVLLAILAAYEDFLTAHPSPLLPSTKSRRRGVKKEGKKPRRGGIQTVQRRTKAKGSNK